jgi:hypothetical protein
MQFAKFRALPPILTAVFAAFGSAQPASAENYLCRQQFALCTSAPCIPQPGNLKVAMCSLRYGQAEHRRVRGSHDLFPILFEAMAAGQEDADLCVGSALDLVPQQTVHGGSRQSQEGDMRVRHRADGGIDHRWWQLQHRNLQHCLLVRRSG